MAGTITERVEGVVDRTNERGFTLRGREGWLNVSKYAQDVIVPAKGTSVSVGLDNAGFVREVQPRRGAVGEPDPLPWQDAPNGTVTVDKDRRISRLAVLNTAAAALASGGREVNPGELLGLAELLEDWVYRE